MTRVMAQGMFEIIHPGQLYYLERSAELGDELYVVVGRDKKAVNRDLVMGEDERLKMVQALDIVDKAVLGSEEGMFEPVQMIKPDIITLGYDQEFSVEEIEALCEEKNIEGVEVVRLGEYDGPTRSVSQLKEKIHKQLDDIVGHNTDLSH